MTLMELAMIQVKRDSTPHDGDSDRDSKEPEASPLDAVRSNMACGDCHVPILPISHLFPRESHTTDNPSLFNCKFASSNCVARSSREMPSTSDGFSPVGRTPQV